MTDNAQKAPSQEASESLESLDRLDRSAYEEERRVLLNSVAQSLSQVVKKMGTINEQLNGLSESNNEVKEVADLWRESFATSRSGSESSSLSLSQSRDLNYCFP